MPCHVSNCVRFRRSLRAQRLSGAFLQSPEKRIFHRRGAEFTEKIVYCLNQTYASPCIELRFVFDALCAPGVSAVRFCSLLKKGYFTAEAQSSQRKLSIAWIRRMPRHVSNCVRFRRSLRPRRLSGAFLQSPEKRIFHRSDAFLQSPEKRIFHRRGAEFTEKIVYCLNQTYALPRIELRSFSTLSAPPASQRCVFAVKSFLKFINPHEQRQARLRPLLPVVALLRSTGAADTG